jgi:uncharacterized protein
MENKTPLRATRTQQIQSRPSLVELPGLVQGKEASLSLRSVTLLELISVISSVLLTVWAIVPLYPQNRLTMAFPALLAIALIFYSQHVRQERLTELGFSSAYAWAALRLLLFPVLLGIGALLGIGHLTHSLRRSTHFELNLFIVPLWGLVQQYVLQGFIYRRVRLLMVDDRQFSRATEKQVRRAILATAAIFALVHLPNFTLSLLTFAAALLWSWVYERAPNLWVLGLSHGSLSLVVMHSLPTWLLQSMSIGYKHFLYQKF